MTDPVDLDAVFAQLEAQLSESGAALSEVAETAAAVDERRDAPRMNASGLGGDVRLSIRGGADARTVNVSETGALAETTSRLRPGSVVELLLQVDGVRHLIRATVVRSMVHSLGPTIFRTAFKFEERTKLPEPK
ncbi:MAG TPA: PilZ domain-containing protein [Vicinamibacterales bacterium]